MSVSLHSSDPYPLVQKDDNAHPKRSDPYPEVRERHYVHVYTYKVLLRHIFLWRRGGQGLWLLHWIEFKVGRDVTIFSRKE